MDAPALLALSAACSSTPSDPAGETAAAFSTEAFVDANVRSFKALASPAGTVLVLGTDGNLWREAGSMSSRTWVDGNVFDYQPLDASITYVLGTDGKLWREVGSMASRTLVASGVRGFSVGVEAATEAVYYVDAQSTLWHVDSTSAPKAILANVRGYQWTPNLGVCEATLYVLRQDLTLLRGDYLSLGTTPLVVDTNISSFRALDAVNVLVETADSKIWAEHNSKLSRSYVDSNAEFFWPISTKTTFIEDNAFKLWRDEYGSRNRDLVDVNVRAYQPMDRDTVYVLHTDGTLYRESLAAPACLFEEAATVCPQTQKGFHDYEFIAAWGVETASGTCLPIPAATGTWTKMRNNVVPNDGISDPITCDSLGLKKNCCLYVWNPIGSSVQDPSVLCNANDKRLKAFVECGAAYSEGPSCGFPGGGGCSSCSWKW